MRPYGLQTANSPYSGKADDKGLDVPAGELVDLRYRLDLLRGQEREGKVTVAYEAFAK